MEIEKSYDKPCVNWRSRDAGYDAQSKFKGLRSREAYRQSEAEGLRTWEGKRAADASLGVQSQGSLEL
jgi:hypothetical protein